MKLVNLDTRINSDQLLGEYYALHSYQDRKESGAEEGKGGRISPSTLVSGCLLVCFYDLLGVDPDPSPVLDTDTQLVLDVGNFVHDRVQSCLKRAYEAEGCIYVVEKQTIISPYCRGKIDGFVMDMVGGDAWPEDYKTCSGNVFKAISNKPKQENYDQVQLYLIGEASCRRGEIIYINRDTLRRKRHVFERDPKRQAELMAMHDSVVEAVEAGSPPEPVLHYFGDKPCYRSCRHASKCALAQERLGTRKKGAFRA